MELRKIHKSKERMKLKAEALHLMEVKMYYGESLVWTAAKDTNQSIESFYDTIHNISSNMKNDVNEIRNSVDEIEEVDISKIEENNKGLIDDLLDNL